MRNLVFVLAAATMLPACHAGTGSHQPDERALKAADAERARKNAGQDAIQAQRQLNLVAERTRNGVQQKSPPEEGTKPKR